MSKPHSTDHISQTTSEREDELTILFKSTGEKGRILVHNTEAERRSYKKHYGTLMSTHRYYDLIF